MLLQALFPNAINVKLYRNLQAIDRNPLLSSGADSDFRFLANVSARRCCLDVCTRETGPAMRSERASMTARHESGDPHPESANVHIYVVTADAVFEKHLSGANRQPMTRSAMGLPGGVADGNWRHLIDINP